jgi:hypothetical protein
LILARWRFDTSPEQARASIVCAAVRIAGFRVQDPRVGIKTQTATRRSRDLVGATAVKDDEFRAKLFFFGPVTASKSKAVDGWGVLGATRQQDRCVVAASS